MNLYIFLFLLQVSAGYIDQIVARKEVSLVIFLTENIRQ